MIPKSIESAWDRHRFNIKMVNPANKRKYNVIVVGTGLAGASAAATLGELATMFSVIFKTPQEHTLLLHKVE